MISSACVALSVSNPIPEPKVFGDVVGIVSDGQDQFLLVQQEPVAVWVLEAAKAAVRNTTLKDESTKEDEPSEEQERSFFFKNWFRPAQPAVSTLSVVQQPQMIRLPQPVILGTVYQPISMVTTPVLSGALTPAISTQQLSGLVGQQGMSGGISTQQLAALFGQQGMSGGISAQQLAALFGHQGMTGTRPSTVTISRPQPSIGVPSAPNGGNNVDINIQQIMRPASQQPDITTPMCGSPPCTSSGHAASGNIGIGEHGGTSETVNVPRPGSTINFEKTIDIMGQINRS